MSNFIHELMLKDYFLTETILKKHCPKLRVFQTLCSIYRIDKNTETELYKLVTSPVVAEIRSYSDYTCYTRIKNYKEMIGENKVQEVLDKYEQFMV